MFTIAAHVITKEERLVEVETPCYKRENTHTLIRIDDKNHITKISNWSNIERRKFMITHELVDKDSMRMAVEMEDATQQEWIEFEYQLKMFLLKPGLFDKEHSMAELTQ